MEKEAKLRQYLLEQYQSLIIDYLFGNSGPDAFRKIASDDYRRQVLIDQMIDVSVNLKGDSREKLTKLYNDLNLTVTPWPGHEADAGTRRSRDSVNLHSWGSGREMRRC
jgi:hypothetical protein